MRIATIWDDDFSYVLSPALSAYESERVTGVCYGNDEFQQAIKKHIPIGHVFKVIIVNPLTTLRHAHVVVVVATLSFIHSFIRFIQ
jgi:hypothetical protein